MFLHSVHVGNAVVLAVAKQLIMLCKKCLCCRRVASVSGIIYLECTLVMLNMYMYALCVYILYAYLQMCAHTQHV